MIVAVFVERHSLGSFPRKNIIAGFNHDCDMCPRTLIIRQNLLIVCKRNTRRTGAALSIIHKVIIQIIVCCLSCPTESILVPSACQSVPRTCVSIYSDRHVCRLSRIRNTLGVSFFRFCDGLHKVVIVLIDHIEHIRGSGSRKNGEADGNARHDHKDREDATQKFFSKFHKVFLLK